MRLRILITQLTTLVALLLMISCNTNDDALPCASDSECPASHYCAQAGGVFFATAQCVQRSAPTTTDDTDDTDLLDAPPSTSEDAALPDADPQADTDPQTEADTTPQTSCTEDADCNDDISCTQDSCVDGFCQNAPDDNLCDDGNTCTDNLCDATLGCTTTHNNAPCDDGFFCNGDDLCANGACSFHQGTTCPDGICNETLQNCTQCAQNHDCGEPAAPIESDCVFEMPCTTTGTRTITTRTPTCENNTCIIIEETSTESCTRPAPAGACGAVTVSDWQDCDFGTNICATTGTQTRTITTPTCENNICLNKSTTETRACTRPNPTEKCKPDKSTWSTCQGPNTCDQFGTQSKSITTFHCAEEQCKPTTLHNTETMHCNRNTNGNACTSDNLSGSCINGCCQVNCPHGQHCLQCLILE